MPSQAHSQKAIKAAVGKTGIGHSDVRTTMIYTHTVKSVTLKEARSPLTWMEERSRPSGGSIQSPPNSAFAWRDNALHAPESGLRLMTREKGFRLAREFRKLERDRQIKLDLRKENSKRIVDASGCHANT